MLLVCEFVILYDDALGEAILDYKYINMVTFDIHTVVEAYLNMHSWRVYGCANCDKLVKCICMNVKECRIVLDWKDIIIWVL